MLIKHQNSMINTKLDSKFESFLLETKSKILELSKELESLVVENYYLEQQVSETFHTNGDLDIEVKHLEEQLQRFNSIHSIHLSELQILSDKRDKAKSDYEKLSAAYNQQSEIQKSQQLDLINKEKDMRMNRQKEEEIYLNELEKLEFKIQELDKAKILKKDTNNGLISQLNASEAIEANILTSIQAEILSLNSITSKGFYKSNNKNF